MMSKSLNDTATLSISSADYCCIITGIRKSRTVNLLQHAGFKLNLKNRSY